MKQVLKDMRVTAKLTQKQVANEFGYTTAQFVSNWERGLVDVPLSTLKKLSKLCNVSVRRVKVLWLDKQSAIFDRA